MYLIRKVCNRTAGMGLKLVKFHAISHIALDIMMFGVPMNVDTGSNESHHKLTKVAARQTQKNPECFEKQTAERVVNFLLLALALCELDGRAVWDYYRGYDNPHMDEVDGDDPPIAPHDVDEGPQKMGGTRIEVFWDPEDNEIGWNFCKSDLKGAVNAKFDIDCQEFLFELQQKLQPWLDELDICTFHKRNGQIFRAHPWYRQGGPWNDWVIVDWGPHGRLPCEIWCFLNLEDLDEDVEVEFGGITIQPGWYAVVESSEYLTEEVANARNIHRLDANKSDLFAPILKEVKAFDDDGMVVEQKFYLADVEAFVEPVVVVPDVGSHLKHKYFHVTPRKDWSEIFIQWLDMPHTLDDMED